MLYIEPHAHMVSRTPDDYQAMALSGCRAVCEPAFWAGFDRGGAGAFEDYFRQLTESEPRRAARFGLPHRCWLCLNSKESEDLALADDVLAVLPAYLDRPDGLGVSEIGLNKNSRNELAVLERHVDLAARRGEWVLDYTPHLEDKLKGTRLIVDLLKSDARIDPGRVLIDHIEEHTAGLVLDAGFWGGITLYPETKCTPARAADLLEIYGGERLWLNCACDWGVSDPLAVPKAALELRRRGHAEADVDRLIFGNPARFLGQCPKFQVVL